MKRLLILSLLLFAGCNEKIKELSNNNLSEEFLITITEERIHSSLYMVIPVYENNEYIEAVITNTQVFYDFYKPDYEKIMPFKEFVNLLLSKEIVLLRENVNPEFYLSAKIEKIEKEYIIHGIQHVIKIYLNQIDESTYRLEKDLSENELFTLIKICFFNNYRISFDGYEGFFMFRK
jgi:hypothetical protein